MNSLNTQVSFVFFALDDVQQSGNLVVLEVQSHIIHSSDCETKENEVRKKKNLWVLSQLVAHCTCAFQTLHRGGESFGSG